MEKELKELLKFYSFKEIVQAIEIVSKKTKGDKWMGKSWYTVEEAAEVLGVSKQTVRDRLSSKEIKGNKVGREWRILKDEVNLILGISKDTNEKDFYIKELENKVAYLTLQNETFKNIAVSLTKVISS